VGELLILKNIYTVLGDEKNPKIQFYHEIVSPKKKGDSTDGFNKMHTQEYYELSFFIFGKRRIKIGEKIYDFKAGEIFLVSPAEPHAGALSHDALDRYRLHIWPRAFDAFPDKDGIMSLFKRIKYIGNRIVLTEESQKLVYNYLYNIDNSIKLGAPETKNISALADIIKLLVLLCELSEGRNIRSTVKNQLLLNILSFIETSYDSVTVSEIESHFSISRATLWRLFQKELSTSPSAYILNIRL
jgi:AraC-like DNA-binding protein